MIQMSTSLFEILATVQRIENARVSMIQISTLILMVLGNIGEILNIIIFLQPTFRSNSCAIYFLAAALARLFLIDFAILINGLSLGYNIDFTQTSLVLCKLRFYLSTLVCILPPSFIILACIDRYMISSMSVRTRLWSRPITAYRLVAGVTIFWLIFTIHTLIGVNIQTFNGYSYCYYDAGSYAIFSAMYAIVFNYLLPPTLMIIFGLLTIINVRRVQKQVHQNRANSQIHQKDRHLLRMLLFQVLINVVFTISPGAYQLYGILSANEMKDLVHQAWDTFFLTMALIMFYIPNCAGFYIYTLTASIFRQELRRIIEKWICQMLPTRKTRVTVIKPNVN